MRVIATANVKEGGHTVARLSLPEDLTECNIDTSKWSIDKSYLHPGTYYHLAAGSPKNTLQKSEDNHGKSVSACICFRFNCQCGESSIVYLNVDQFFAVGTSTVRQEAATDKCFDLMSNHSEHMELTHEKPKNNGSQLALRKQAK
ncbi:hypothetical protein OESDEN_03371 [Oesophagostomum dentatum]|uniref:Uncharacterized protein n=1 Tax=Oesophagostomum dentatum TaxID=61180 RepID=A0A0B1TKS4_OESDE|nr:hypothetical protein OESDEN_03371 [Oesophagostomum dentatum]